MTAHAVLASPAVEAVTDHPSFDALAHGFVDASNQRDADALIALAHPRIVFRPSTVGGRRRTYVGHDGLRRWVAELLATSMDFQVRIREIRPLGPSDFLLLSTLRVSEEMIVDYAMIAAAHEDQIIQAHSYLSDESILAHVGLIPERAASGAL